MKWPPRDPANPHAGGDQYPELYASIFREGDSAAFALAQHNTGLGPGLLMTCLNSTFHRRAVLVQSDEGFTSPEALADYLAAKMSGVEATEFGIIEISSPNGRMRAIHRQF